MSASAYFAIWCWTTVFPEPNGPGIAAVPPLATGKKVSITLWPVISGSFGSIFLLIGRAFLTGQYWIIFSSLSPSSVSTTAMVSATLNSPDLISFNLPFTPFGTIILWVITVVSSTSPSISPGTTSAPFSKRALNSQTLSLSSPGEVTPLVRKFPASSSSFSSGLWIPSYILSSMPGPSSTDRGLPVDLTSSPGPIPVVSS